MNPYECINQLRESNEGFTFEEINKIKELYKGAKIE